MDLAVYVVYIQIYINIPSCYAGPAAYSGPSGRVASVRTLFDEAGLARGVLSVQINHALTLCHPTCQPCPIKG